MKKHIWKILLGVNLLLLFEAGYWGWNLWQEKLVNDARQERLDKVSASEKSLSNSKGSNERRSGTIDHTYVSLAYPIGTQSKPIPLIEERMNTYVEEKYGKSLNVASVTHAVYVDSTVSDTSFEGVKHYELEARTYEDNDKEFVQTASEVFQSYDLKVDGQIFNLSDLFVDQEQFKELLLTRTQKELSVQDFYPEDAEYQIQRLSQMDINQLKYTYENANLTIILPSNIGAVSQVQFAISELFPIINETYLKGDDLIAYQDYLVKERLAEGPKRIALTFDDGPNPTTTTQILDVLAKYNVKATFFVIGSKVTGNEAIIKREVSDGHEIGNHTWSHPILTQLTQADIQDEVNMTNQAIQAASGQAPKTIRPPYGATNATVAAASGLPEVLWTVDTRDWENHNPAQILANVKTYARPNGVILMHDIHQETANAVESVILYLQSEGYEFVTVSELYGY
ncbi:polysaccharide deacetylase family protein [Streptococcus caprae]|uniref:Polysaccharide deacetylase family protein n=1 Tax=Streptococcus caprae TaxID=1640501 RepID=A0ABV8CW70_9STRE